MENIFRVACIGSRDIGEDTKKLLFRIGAYIASSGGYVSSGNAIGSDEWYGKGVNSVDPTRLILYLPWATYNEEFLVEGNRITTEERPEWIEEAKKYHPSYVFLKQGGKKMMHRNIGIISRADCTLAVLNHRKIGGGGTGHGWRASLGRKIPALDLAQYGNSDESFEKVKNWIDEQRKTCVNP